MPPTQPFVHLHLHTSYSLLDSTIKIKPLVKQAAKLEMPALAITDHSVMHGAINFYNACQGAGIKPIIGCEMNTCKDMNEKSRNAGRMSHLLLLAKDEEGYHNLARLSARAHLEGFYYKPRIDMELLSQYSKGLIATSCCMRGEIPQYLQDDLQDEAERVASQYRELFGAENFYFELEDHGIPAQKKVNAELIRMSQKLDIPLVATNDVHYMEQKHAEAHDVLLSMQSQAKFRDEKRIRFEGDQYYFKTQAEMWELFGHVPEALHNTVEIMDRCNVKLKLNDEADLHFPIYPLPETFTDDEDYLTHLAEEGIKKLYDGADITNPQTEMEHTLKDRWEMEFGVIKRTGYVNYFLVVWDFINWARRHDIPVGPGRGSGAGSLVAYALGITAVDPLHFGLIFERFLNPDRVSPPDFDIDFCQTRRPEVIEYVKDFYGQQNCAQIITFGTLGAKTVIRDIGRTMEIPLAYCDQLAKLIPEDPGMTLAKAEELSPDFKKALADPQAQQIMKYARILEGLHRNQGTHAAGVVIGEKTLHDIIPLCRDKDGLAVAQYEMKPLEMTGLLKMDFLGLKTLSVIQGAVDNVKETHGISIDPLKLPLDDPKTFELLGRGDTVAVFQVESEGMRNLLRQFQADKIEEIIALIALYRPGPMSMIPGYIDCKHGRKEIEYAHPLLEQVLKETYGVFIYQEQVQRASNVLAGFTLAQGDLLRRAMGKKDANIMAEMKAKFVEGCKEVNGIPAQKATEIFETIEKFASYGFNKSHSAAYAFVTFQTAYFKAHYPAEFMASVLTLEIGNAEKLTGFIAECKEMGMEVLPPDIRQSVKTFRPEDGNIRYGLSGIKGVGAAAVDSLVADREANGPFESFMDFCTRLDSKVVNKRCLEGLIKAGAFDWTGISRARLFGGIDFALQRAVSLRKDREQGQTSLFDLMAEETNQGELNDEELPEVDPWATSKMLAYEKDLLGFYISGHPLEEFEWEIETFSTHHFDNLSELNDKDEFRMGGLITEWRKFFTKTGNEMASFVLEGLNGHLPVVMFKETVQQFAEGLHNELPVMVAGEFSLRDDAPQMVISEITVLEKVPEWYAEKASVHLTDSQAEEKTLRDLREKLKAYSGNTPLHFCVSFPAGERVFMNSAPEFKVHPGHKFKSAVEDLFGEDTVFIKPIDKVCKLPPRQRSFGGPPADLGYS
ncbi:DNA polymerase III subunit alpha [Kiritimatiellaeota bacterium B1221]|nr:DNA polymerase III subunit alpha [Kiritimatiellaeota bacterium B1221]